MRTTPAPVRTRLLHGAAALLVVAAFGAAGWYGYEKVVSHPIERVTFAGATERIPGADLDALAQGIRAAAVRPSLENVRQAARRLPWVRDAGVRRVSIDTIEIRIDAHEPLARWNDDALVNRRGEVFAATFDGALPRLRGGEGTAPEMARQYAALSASLRPLESPIAELRLTPRRAWQVTLESGLLLELGRGETESRVARIATAWPELQARGVATNHIDLRYANGFALRKTEKEKKKA